jgi:sugar-specific transcriptional regulator TrmB
MSDATDALLPLGFTDLEAAAYVFLLQSGPATGYRVAQGIDKPVANAYKSLQSLQSKGAVWLEEGGSRRFRAVPPGELLHRIQQDFGARRKRAVDALSSLARPQPRDEQIYRLSTPAQVYERCRAVLGKAKRLVLIDVFPLPLGELRDDIAACARRRGVRVAAQVYEPAEIARVDVALNFRAAAVKARWKDQWVNIAADSAEYVVALLGADGSAVRHATWSTNVFLAHTFLSGLAAEIYFSALQAAIARGANGAERQRIMARYQALVEKAEPPRE